MTSREWLTAVVLGLIVTALLIRIYFPAAMVGVDRLGRVRRRPENCARSGRVTVGLP